MSVETHQAFSSIIGQERAIEFLSRALKAGRLHHGLMFVGPEGVGRFKTATRLASIFLAEKSDDLESVEKTFKLISAQTHPDFHLVTRTMVRDLEGKGANKAIALSVDVIREFLVAPAGKKSFTGRGKVFIVDEADTMNSQAQNAMLKTLEEPAGRALIILLSEQHSALLPTIRSRSQLVQFNRLTNEQAIEIVKQQGVDASMAKLAVELAEGSPGRALRYVRDGVVLASKQLITLLDSTDPNRADALADFLKASADAFAEKRLEQDPQGSKDGFTRDGVITYLTLASNYLRRKLGSDADEELCERIDAIRSAEIYLDGNVNLSLIVRQVGAALAS
ncbi:MAG TPA: hypothetical protein PK402_07500 [Tepidisphaeraceae bacterium]|nr:hypothetical protein [Tepidisphaeraceae bacterium]